MLDMLTRLLGRSFVILMILLFHLCDFLYSYALYLVNLMPHPASFHHLLAYNIVISPIPRMFWAGIIGSVVAGIVEVFIYSLLQKKIKTFFIASYLSTAIIVFAHGIPTDYFAFNKAFPNQVWHLVFNNIIMNIVILTAYIIIASTAMKLIGKQYYKKTDEPLNMEFSPGS